MPSFLKPCFKLRRKQKRSKKREQYIKPYSDVTTHITREEIIQECQSTSNASSVNANDNDEINEASLNTSNTTDTQSINQNGHELLSEIKEGCDTESDAEGSVASESNHKTSTIESKQECALDAHSTDVLKNKETKLSIIEINKIEQNGEEESITESDEDSKSIQTSSLKAEVNINDDFLESNPYIQKSLEIINKITVISDVFQKIEELEALESAAKEFQQQRLENIVKVKSDETQICNDTRDTGDTGQIVTGMPKITELPVELLESSTNGNVNVSETETGTNMLDNKVKPNVECNIYNDKSTEEETLEYTSTSIETKHKEENDFKDDKRDVLDNFESILNKESIKKDSGDWADNIRMPKTLPHSKHKCIDIRTDLPESDHLRSIKINDKDLPYFSDGDTSIPNTNEFVKENLKLSSGDNRNSDNFPSGTEFQTHHATHLSSFKETYASEDITSNGYKSNLQVQEGIELSQEPESANSFNDDYTDTDSDSPDRSLNSTISDSEVFDEDTKLYTDRKVNDMEFLPIVSGNEDSDYDTVNECPTKTYSDFTSDALESPRNRIITENGECLDSKCENSLTNVGSTNITDHGNDLPHNFGVDETPECKTNFECEELSESTEHHDTKDFQDQVMEIKEKYEHMHSRIKRKIQNINNELITFNAGNVTDETNLKDTEYLSMDDTNTLQLKSSSIPSKERNTLENHIITDFTKDANNLEKSRSEDLEYIEVCNTEVKDTHNTSERENSDLILIKRKTKDAANSITTILNRLTDTFDVKNKTLYQENNFTESNKFSENSTFSTNTHIEEFIHAKNDINEKKGHSTDHSEINNEIESKIENVEKLYKCCFSENIDPMTHAYNKSLSNYQGYSDMIRSRGDFNDEGEFQCEIKNRLNEIDYFFQTINPRENYQNFADESMVILSPERKHNNQRKQTEIDMQQHLHTVKHLNEVISDVQKTQFTNEYNHDFNKLLTKNDEKHIRHLKSHKIQDHKSIIKHALSSISLSSQSSNLSQGGDSKDVDVGAKRSEAFTITEWGDNRNDRGISREYDQLKKQNVRYKEKNKGMKYILGGNKKLSIKSQNTQEKALFPKQCPHNYKGNVSSESEIPTKGNIAPKKEPLLSPNINAYNLQCGDHYINLPSILRQKFEDKIDIIQNRLNVKESECNDATPDSEKTVISSDSDEIEKRRRENIEIFNRRKLQAMSDMGSTLRVIPIKKADIDLDFTSKDNFCVDRKETSPQIDVGEMECKKDETPPIEIDKDNASDYFQVSSTESDTETSSEISEKISPNMKRIIDISRSVRSPKYQFKNQFKINKKAFYSRKPVIVKSSKVNIVAYVTQDKNIYQGYKYKPSKDDYKYVTKKRFLIPRDLSKRHEVTHTFIHRASSPNELRSKFDDSFRKYASRGRPNGDLISYKKSTEWLRDAGIVGKDLTAEEANDVFKCIAGVKIALNKGDYRNFLKKLTRVKRLNYNEIYKRLCAAEYKCTE